MAADEGAAIATGKRIAHRFLAAGAIEFWVRLFHALFLRTIHLRHLSGRGSRQVFTGFQKKVVLAH